MPVYHAPLLQIDPKETRRYAGLMNAKEFDEQMILDACEDGLLLAEPRGIWTLYDYDCQTQTVATEPPVRPHGGARCGHLAVCGGPSHWRTGHLPDSSDDGLCGIPLLQ